MCGVVSFFCRSIIYLLWLSTPKASLLFSYQQVHIVKQNNVCFFSSLWWVTLKPLNEGMREMNPPHFSPFIYIYICINGKLMTFHSDSLHLQTNIGTSYFLHEKTHLKVICCFYLKWSFLNSAVVALNIKVDQNLQRVYFRVRFGVRLFCNKFYIFVQLSMNVFFH